MRNDRQGGARAVPLSGSRVWPANVASLIEEDLVLTT